MFLLEKFTFVSFFVTCHWFVLRKHSGLFIMEQEPPWSYRTFVLIKFTHPGRAFRSHASFLYIEWNVESKNEITNPKTCYPFSISI